MTNNKIINAGASLIIPGLGQLLNGQTQKGIIFLAIAITPAIPMYLAIF